jgi:ABC-2 type transport system ATP-binding protein
MLNIVRLSKRFGERVALDDVSLHVAPGEIVGLVGPNGAGRSILLRIIAGFVAPSSGSVTVGGHDIRARPLAAKRLLGYLPPAAPAYPDMTGAGFLGFVARLRGMRGEAARRRIADLAVRLDLADLLDRPIAALANDARRRLGVAQAVLHDPPLLLLDEPTEGLDPGQRHATLDTIRTTSPAKAILVATNRLEDVEVVCSRVIVFAGGQIRADDTPAALVARSRFHNAVRLVVAPGADISAITAALAQLPLIRSIEPVRGPEGDGWWLFPWRGRTIVGEIAELARRRGWKISALYAERGRLDDVFQALVTAAPDVRAAGSRDAA